MAERKNVLIDENTMESIGDAIRFKLNGTTKYLPREMPDAIASISGGGTGAIKIVKRPNEVGTFDYEIEGIDISDTTADAGDVVVGKYFYTNQGEKLEGTLVVHDDPVYDTPTIQVSSTGLITATANGKSNTSQLSTQAMTTVNPTESEQTAVTSGKYTTGAVKIGAISSTYVGSGITRQAAKTVTPTESSQTAVASGVYTTGAITVGAISNTYVGSGVTKQAAKTVTPTKSSQTAVASGTYTTGAVTVGAIPAEYIVPSGSETKTSNGTYDVTNLAQLVVNVAGGGTPLPEGMTAIDYGSYTLNSAVAGGSTFTVPHNLGQVPDMFLFFTPTNIATTYSMLGVFRSSWFGWRSSSYLNKVFYHGNSTTTTTGTDVTTSYGVKTLTATNATITTYSTSTSYYWRAGTYKYIAIKF